MQYQLKSSLNKVLETRYLAVLLGVFFALCLTLLIYLIVSVQPSDLQVVVHYTSFGTTNFYRDQWHYLLTFIGFVVIIATMHPLITYKILINKGKELAIAFAWLGVVMVLISAALFYQVLKIASLS